MKVWIKHGTFCVCKSLKKPRRFFLPFFLKYDSSFFFFQSWSKQRYFLSALASDFLRYNRFFPPRGSSTWCVHARSLPVDKQATERSGWTRKENRQIILRLQGPSNNRKTDRCVNKFFEPAPKYCTPSWYDLVLITIIYMSLSRSYDVFGSFAAAGKKYISTFLCYFLMFIVLFSKFFPSFRLGKPQWRVSWC